MAYENDIIMRQVRDMTRMLAKILFGKNTATYEYKEEDRHTATDSLYARLIALVDAGKINEAENRLYEELERDEEGTFEVALGFYDYLNELPEEFLEEHDYSKEEVKEGAQSLADRKGLGLLGEDLISRIRIAFNRNVRCYFLLKNFVTCHITLQTGSIQIRREESSWKILQSSAYFRSGHSRQLPNCRRNTENSVRACPAGS